jgi:uncharacterized protein (TIGR02246 family)
VALSGDENKTITSSFEKAQKEIWQVVKDMNDAWVKGRPENLVNFFHEDMVIVGPDLQKRGEGRQACVKSYEDFCTRATVHDFKEMDLRIDVYDDTAIATYSYEITYEMNGKTFHETGRDVFVLVRERNKWWTVWRLPLPGKPKSDKNE